MREELLIILITWSWKWLQVWKDLFASRSFLITFKVIIWTPYEVQLALLLFLSIIWINSHEKNKKWGLGSLGPLKSRPQIPLKWWFSWFFRCLGLLAYLTHLQHPWPVYVLANLKRVSANQKIIIEPTLRHLTASKLRQVTSYKHFCHFLIFYRKDAYITYRRTSCTWIILCHSAPRLYVRTWKNK